MACWSSILVIIFSILFVYLDISSAVSPIAPWSSYHINGKKAINSVSDRFLSYTLEPEVLTYIEHCPEINANWNLIRALLPAYLRIGGPDSNKLIFQSNPEGKLSSNDGASTQNKPIQHKNLVITGPQWLKFIDFANKTGLQIIVSLNGHLVDKNSNVDLTNALEFITYSNKNNFDLDWQLGYELQRTVHHDGQDMGHDVSRLRKVLEVFPRYQKSLILGPDVTRLTNKADVAFVRTYLAEASDSLDVFTLHHDFSGTKEYDDVYEKLSPTFDNMDTYLWIKEGGLKAVSRGVVARKPIWFAEAENKDRASTFPDTLSFIQRLGVTAKLGTSVYLRKPHLMSLYEPTSEYWAAVLFKALVGKTVLDAKLVNGNNTKVFAFSQCTKVSSPTEESILNPNLGYERGAVTLYGVNAGTESSRLSLKLNSRYEQIVHFYALTEDTSGGIHSPKTLLNKQELHMSADNELPMVSPKIREYAKFVVVPSQSVFFLVLPNAKARACVYQSADETRDTPTKNKSHISNTNEDATSDDNPTPNDSVQDFDMDEVDDKTIYVSYPKRHERSHVSLLDNSDSKLKFSRTADPRINTKYITYSDDTWLSSLPEQLKEIFNKAHPRANDYAPSSAFTSLSPFAFPRKESRISKINNYRILSQAVLGKRNTTHFTSESEANKAATDMSPSIISEPEKMNTRFSRSVPVVIEQLEMADINEVNDFSSEEENNHSSQETVIISNDESPTIENNEQESNEEDEEKSTIIRLLQESESLNHDDIEKELLWDARIRRDTVGENTNSLPAADLEQQPNFEDIEALVLDNDDDDFENIRSSRGISANTAAFIDQSPHDLRHLPNSLHPISPFPHKSKKAKAVASDSKPTPVIVHNEESTNLSSNLEVQTTPSEVHVSLSYEEAKSDPQLGTSAKNEMQAEVFSVVSVTPEIDQSSKVASPLIETKISTFQPIEGTSISIAPRARNVESSDNEDGDLPLYMPFHRSTHASKHSNENLHPAKPMKTPIHRIKHDSTSSSPIHKPKTPILPHIKPIHPKVAPQASQTLPELLDTTNAKLKEIIDNRKAKIKELRQKLRNKSLEVKTKHESGLAESQNRNKRNVVESNDDGSSNLKYATSASQRPKHTRKPTPSTPRARKSTSASHRHKSTSEHAPFHNKSRFEHLPFHSRITTEHSPIKSLHNSSLPSFHSHNRRGRRVERDLAEDAFNKTKDVCKNLSANAKKIYTDVSGSVKETLSPIINWVEHKYHDMQHELVSVERGKRDVTNLKNRIQEGHERLQRKKVHIRQQILHSVGAREVSDVDRAPLHHTKMSRNMNLRPAEEQSTKDLLKNYGMHGNASSSSATLRPAHSKAHLTRAVKKHATHQDRNTMEASEQMVNARPVRSLANNDLYYMDDDDFEDTYRYQRSSSDESDLTREGKVKHENLELSNDIEGGLVPMTSTIVADFHVDTTKNSQSKMTADNDLHVSLDVADDWSTSKTSSSTKEETCDSGNVFVFFWCTTKNLFNRVCRVLNIQ